MKQTNEEHPESKFREADYTQYIQLRHQSSVKEIR